MSFYRRNYIEGLFLSSGIFKNADFPLRAGAFEGNKAETATMIPMINDFMKAHSLDDVVVVADAGMINEECFRRKILS